MGGRGISGWCQECGTTLRAEADVYRSGAPPRYVIVLCKPCAAGTKVLDKHDLLALAHDRKTGSR